MIAAAVQKKELERLAYRIERARASADMIKGLALTLDDSGHPCTACGLHVSTNLSDARKREVLDGMVQKLERIIGSWVAEERDLKEGRR